MLLGWGRFWGSWGGRTGRGRVVLKRAVVMLGGRVVRRVLGMRLVESMGGKAMRLCRSGVKKRRRVRLSGTRVKVARSKSLSCPG